MNYFVTRDKNGTVHLHERKPIKGFREWWIGGRSSLILEESELPQGVNPRWEDDEPTKVNVTITKA